MNSRMRLQWKQTYRNRTAQDWKNILWPRFLLRHTDGKVRIWCQHHVTVIVDVMSLLVPIITRHNATACWSIIADHASVHAHNLPSFFQHDNAACTMIKQNSFQTGFTNMTSPVFSIVLPRHRT